MINIITPQVSIYRENVTLPHPDITQVGAFPVDLLRCTPDTAPTVLLTYVSPALCEAINLALVLTTGVGEVAIKFRPPSPVLGAASGCSQQVAVGADVRVKDARPM